MSHDYGENGEETAADREPPRHARIRGVGDDACQRNATGDAHEERRGNPRERLCHGAGWCQLLDQHVERGDHRGIDDAGDQQQDREL